MNYYSFHIGDFVAATVHLSPMEELAYRRLLDMYYDTERPIPLETESVSRRLRLGSDVVENILKEFFFRGEDGWHNDRCDAEIAAYQRKADQARMNGKLGGRKRTSKSEPKKNQSGSDSLTGSKANQEPITNNQYIYPQEFELVWGMYPTRPGASKKDAFKAWSARVKSGVLPDLIAEGVKRYAAYCDSLGVEPKFIKQPATFFGTGEHYLSDWTATSKPVNDPWEGAIRG